MSKIKTPSIAPGTWSWGAGVAGGDQVFGNHFSLLHRSSEKAGILDYCKENAIIFYSYMILEQGALSGKYNVSHSFPDGSDRAKSYNPVLAQMETLLGEMKKITEKYESSAVQIAVTWAIAKGTLPIVGVTETEQIMDVVKATHIHLTDNEVEILDNAGDLANICTLREWEKQMVE